MTFKIEMNWALLPHIDRSLEMRAPKGGAEALEPFSWMPHHRDHSWETKSAGRSQSQTTAYTAGHLLHGLNRMLHVICFAQLLKDSDCSLFMDKCARKRLGWKLRPHHSKASRTQMATHHLSPLLASLAFPRTLLAPLWVLVTYLVRWPLTPWLLQLSFYCQNWTKEKQPHLCTGHVGVKCILPKSLLFRNSWEEGKEQVLAVYF